MNDESGLEGRCQGEVLVRGRLTQVWVEFEISQIGKDAILPKGLFLFFYRISAFGVYLSDRLVDRLFYPV